MCRVAGHCAKGWCQSPGPWRASVLGRPQAWPALAVYQLCTQQDTSRECAGPSGTAPAHAAAHSCDRLRGPSATFLSCKGFSCISGLCCRRLLEGMWEKPVSSFWDFIASPCGHCNIEPFGTGIGGAGQSLDPQSCGCRVVAYPSLILSVQLGWSLLVCVVVN